MKKHFLEGLTLVVLATICALVSNAVAGRERKMALTGYYPGALNVPKQTAEEPPPIASATPAPATITTVAPSAAPQQPAATTTTTPATTSAAPVLPKTTSTPVTKPAPAATQPPPTPAAATPKSDILAKFKEHPSKQYIEIAFGDVKTLHDNGVLFLDARRTSVYEQGHIAGARPFSVWESDIDDKVKKLWEERQDPAQQALPIVVYCSGGDCEDSHMLAQKLWGAQFNNVYVYKDGFPDWQQHGESVHTGSNP